MCWVRDGKGVYCEDVSLSEVPKRPIKGWKCEDIILKILILRLNISHSTVCAVRLVIVSHILWHRYVCLRQDLSSINPRSKYHRLLHVRLRCYNILFYEKSCYCKDRHEYYWTKQFTKRRPQGPLPYDPVFFHERLKMTCALAHLFYVELLSTTFFINWKIYSLIIYHNLSISW